MSTHLLCHQPPGWHHDVNSLTGPTALLASPPSICSSFYTPLWLFPTFLLSLCVAYSVTCLLSAFGRMPVAVAQLLTIGIYVFSYMFLYGPNSSVNDVQQGITSTISPPSSQFQFASSGSLQILTALCYMYYGYDAKNSVNVRVALV